MKCTFYWLFSISKVTQLWNNGLVNLYRVDRGYKRTDMCVLAEEKRYSDEFDNVLKNFLIIIKR